MTFTLTVNTEKFRNHTTKLNSEIVNEGHRLVPVIKGNGYGFGRHTLIQESQHLGVSRIAIGTVWELSYALEHFSGEVHVLEPINSLDSEAYLLWRKVIAGHNNRIIATLSTPDLQMLTEIGVRRFFLEGRTSLNRFGLTPEDLEQTIAQLPTHLQVEGLLLHLPITDSNLPSGNDKQDRNAHLSGRIAQCHDWLDVYTKIANSRGLNAHVSLSHISLDDLRVLKKTFPDFTFGLRLGTKLWLGDLSALKATGTVLAIHDISGSSAVGYQQRRATSSSRIAIISGGTAHGVALSAPITTTTLRKKVIAIIEGFYQAMNKVRSPFIYDGKNLLFVEPPHMHVSMVWLPSDSTLKVGEMVECTIRQTTVTSDRVLGLD